MFELFGLKINRGTFGSPMTSSEKGSVIHTYKSLTDTISSINSPGYFPVNFDTDISNIFIGDAISISGSDGVELFEITSLNPVGMASIIESFPSGITTTTVDATTSITSPLINTTTINATDVNTSNVTASGTITTVNLNGTGTLSFPAISVGTINSTSNITTTNSISAGDDITAADNITSSTMDATTSLTTPIGNISTVNATDVNSTTVDATNITASNNITCQTLNATTSITTPLANATTVSATNVNATGTFTGGALSATSITDSGTLSVTGTSTLTDNASIAAGAGKTLTTRAISASGNITTTGVVNCLDVNASGVVYPGAVYIAGNGNITTVSGVVNCLDFNSSGTTGTNTLFATNAYFGYGLGALNSIYFFDQWEATVSVSGPWASPRNTFMRVVRINNCLLYYILGLPAAPATIASAMFIADGTVPAAFRPSILRDIGPFTTINASVFQVSSVAIRSTGGVVISGNLQNSGPFTAAGDAGFYNIDCVLSTN